MSKQEKKSGFVDLLIKGGLSAFLANALITTLQEDEKIVSLVEDGKAPVIFMTQQDSKVDDKICLPLEGSVFERNSPQRPWVEPAWIRRCGPLPLNF